jgi:hypothetical protein
MSMIERVARALFDESCLDISYDSLHEAEREYWSRLATAAIAVMREPTEAMVRAGDRAECRDDIWPEMIDAALKEHVHG